MKNVTATEAHLFHFEDSFAPPDNLLNVSEITVEVCAFSIPKASRKEDIKFLDSSTNKYI